MIRENSFGTLITATNEEPFATHIPLLLEGDQLIGHMAKANPHWKEFDGNRQALAIFQGPHAYVSPQIYVTAPNVPTWNYVTVHVYGNPRVIDDATEAMALLYKTMATYDPTYPMTDDLRKHMESQVKGIVAFRIPIDRMEGKFKLNQNKKEEDRNAVITKFSLSSNPHELDVANAMKSIYS